MRASYLTRLRSHPHVARSHHARRYLGGKGQPINITDDNLKEYLHPDDARPYDPPATVAARSVPATYDGGRAVGVPHAPAVAVEAVST